MQLLPIQPLCWVQKVSAIEAVASAVAAAVDAAAAAALAAAVVGVGQLAVRVELLVTPVLTHFSAGVVVSFVLASDSSLVLAFVVDW